MTDGGNESTGSFSKEMSFKFTFEEIEFGGTMNRPFRYPLQHKIYFYSQYLMRKLLVPFEMRQNRLAFWKYETKYTLAKVLRRDASPSYFGENMVQTKFGSFYVRLGTTDAVDVSPAYERPDINFLRKITGKLLKQKKKVLFLDVGGDIGAYSILMGNQFKDENLSIRCFEPLEDSCEYIYKNLKLNQLTDRVSVYPFALYNEDDQKIKFRYVKGSPSQSSMVNVVPWEAVETTVQTKQLDTVLLSEVGNYDCMVLKLDVEGSEEAVLEGAKAVLESCPEVYLVVEDFVKDSIIPYLEKEGWDFMHKKTNYNSWWKKIAKEQA